MKCDQFLAEHLEDRTICDDPDHRAALSRRAEGAPDWSPIERRREHGDSRDYLDGKPIHCGAGLELQAFEYRSDDFGEYALKLPIGVRVRYEMDWPRPGQLPLHHAGPRGLREDDRRVMLHVGISGHEFVAEHHARMRFRWPPRH